MEGKEANATSLPMSYTKVDIAPTSNSSNSSTNLEVSDTKGSIYSRIVTGVDICLHILVVCLTAITVSHSLPLVGYYSLHVILCTVGYVLLMSEAIVVLAGDNMLTNFLTRRAKKHIHWFLQILGMICIVSGVVLMYGKKKVHFKSIHAILGITSLGVMIFLTVFGYPVFIAVKLRNIVRPAVIKFVHNFLGLFCFATGMASLCYGYKMLFASDNTPYIAITTIIAIFSVRGALPTLTKQFVTLFVQ